MPLRITTRERPEPSTSPSPDSGPEAGESGGPQGPGNVQAVLDLNGVRYFTLQGRLFRVAPLPFERGLTLQALWVRTVTAAQKAGQDPEPYRRALAEMAAAIWAVVEPGQRSLRLLRRLGLVRNPFARASEAELKDVALFCLGCRTSSRVGTQSVRTPTPRARVTRSTR